MKLLVAPLELKGTLSAREAAEAMFEGLAQAGWADEVDLAPLSDGGPGFLEALRTPSSIGEATRVRDPLGREVEATWLREGPRAVIEMAAASGLARVAPEERDAGRASSEGTGELLRAALDAGCTHILIGAGGSATNDGGVGAARALGVRFLDANGRELEPGGLALSRLEHVDLSRRDPRLTGVRLEIATDVRNPLLGPLGATRIYGPQKGADAATLEALERGLERLAAVVRADLGGDLARHERMGAAGGLAFGLSALCGAAVRDGFACVAEALELERRVRAADWVLTAEGQLDAQSAQGKGTLQLAGLCAGHQKPCCAFVGQLGPGAPVERFTQVIAAPGTRATAREHLRDAVAAWAAVNLTRPG